MNEQNKGLNAEIEPISEETENELTELLKDFINDTENVVSNHINFRDAIFNVLLANAQKRLIFESKIYTKYCYNFVFSTFITRWYWKRKMNKQSDIIKKTMKDIENVKAIYEKD